MTADEGVEAGADPKWPLHRNPYVWGFVVGCAFITLVKVLGLTEHIPDEPALLYSLPSWSMVDQDGASFGSEQLAGDVWVAGFFFSRCQSVCPPLLADMSRLATRYQEQDRAVRVVAFSVDPDHDTPQVLTETAALYGANHDRWTFVTGSRAQMKSLVEGSFKVAMGDLVRGEANMFEVAHTGKLVIVDEAGGIRGYYDHDDVGRDEVYHRSQHVVREAKKRKHAAEKAASR
jgi:protein SCO1/2